MNILFVSEFYLPHVGGVEYFFQSLAEGMAARGHCCTVVTQRLANTKPVEVINGVTIHRVDCFQSRNWFTFLAIPLVYRLARGCDVIHTTTYNAAFPAKVAGLFTGKPCVITVHEILGNNWYNLGLSRLSAGLHQLLERLIINLGFHVYVSGSHSTERSMMDCSVPRRRSRMIYDGIDYAFWDPRRYNGTEIREKLGLEDRFVFLFFGRPGLTKGLEYLVKAVPLVVKEIPEAMFLAIVSSGQSSRERYRHITHLVKALNIENHVIMLDTMPKQELPSYLKAADCVVSPSLTEGFGFTAVEACAMGRPVIASNTDSLPEVVSGRYSLVEPGNPEELARGIVSAYRGELETSPLKRFPVEITVGSYLDLYGELMGKSVEPNASVIQRDSEERT